MDAWIVVALVGAALIIVGLVAAANADDTPAAILGGLCAVLGLVIAIGGGLGYLVAWSDHREHVNDRKFVLKAKHELATQGSHWELHRFYDDRRVIAFVHSDGRSCAAYGNLSHPVCVKASNEPVWGPSLRKALKKQIEQEAK